MITFLTEHYIISVIISVILLSVSWKLLFLVFGFCTGIVMGIVIIPDDSMGMITKKFVFLAKSKQRSLPPGRIIALEGEAGFQAKTLPPGWHFFFWPWQYKIDIKKFITISPGTIGVVEAIDGDVISSGRIVAGHVDCNMFQDAEAFLKNGGKRGPQMDIIPSGTYRINTLLFKVSNFNVLNVPHGSIGIVEARDGAPLDSGRVIAKRVSCDSFQDGEAFMENGGERGPQMDIIPPGSYRINPFLFDTELVAAVDIPDNKIGIVTARDGKQLEKGEIAGSAVEGHDMFCNPDAFIKNGGYKGLQEQVLLSGRYFLNPRFASVEIVSMTEVPIAHVGVVISYVGEKGEDVTGDSFRHGNLVEEGRKGVWNTVLDPGRYPINTRTQNVSPVPTANVVLNWANEKSEAHKLDSNLCTITVRSSDGFKFNLDVAQIIHIPRDDAPRVIARFGSMEALVTQVLEPTIGNYFRNAAQNSDVIDFLKGRSARQGEARDSISKALSEYNVGGVDTLIGDISPPEELMKTLTDRKVAEQEQITFGVQQAAQVVKQGLEQATAIANTQSRVVDAERKVTIADFEAQAKVKEAKGTAESKTINAEADANVLQTVGAAEGEKIQFIGKSEAEVIRLKIESIKPEHYAAIQVAEKLAGSGQPLVPRVLVSNGGKKNHHSGVVDLLMANLVSKNVGGGGVEPGVAKPGVAEPGVAEPGKKKPEAKKVSVSDGDGI